MVIKDSQAKALGKANSGVFVSYDDQGNRRAQPLGSDDERESAYKEFRDGVVEVRPDVCIFMLGHNDSWHSEFDLETFAREWTAMVYRLKNELKDVKGNPTRLFVCVPPPILKDGQYDMRAKIVNEIFPKLIPKL